MWDWLYRRRDPAAITVTVAAFALAWLWGRWAPPVSTSMKPVQDIEVLLEDVTPPAPPPPVAPPVPQPQRPQPQEAQHPTPTPEVLAAPTPSPQPADVVPPPSPAPAPVRAASAAVAPPAPAPQVTAPPAPAAPPAPPHPAVNVEAQYAGQVRSYLDSIKRYPSSREARQLRPEGVVKVWLVLDRSGALQDTGVEQSAGTALLDSEALRTVHQGHYPAWPDDAWPGQSTHRFVISIEYSVKR